MRSIGADHVIDYTKDDFADGETRYDLILDVGGDSALSRLRRALTPKGTLVIVGGEGGGNWIGMGRQLRALALSPFVGQRLTILGPKEHYTFLERLTELIEDDRLVPAVEQDIPTQRDAGRHATAGSRTRARQARHHHHRPDRSNQLIAGDWAASAAIAAVTHPLWRQSLAVFQEYGLLASSTTAEWITRAQRPDGQGL